MRNQDRASADDGAEDLERLMQNYGRDVINLAYSYVKNYHQAQDIAQDVFLKAFVKRDSFRGQSSIKTWLLSITANRCKDYLRSWTIRHEVQDESGMLSHSASMNTEREIVSKLERDELWQLVHQLPTKYREVIVLYYQQELNSLEIAKVLGISEQSVRTRLHRGRAMVRDHMTEKEGDR